MAESESNVGVETPEEKPKQKLTLEVTVTQPSACQRHVAVVIPREDIDRYFSEAFDKVMPEAQVPGFRPGRAPRALVKKSFRKQLEDQVKGSLLMDAMGQVSDEQKFAAISEPDFDIQAVEVPEAGAMKFEFNVEVRPDFQLPQWKGLKIDKPMREFTEADVQRHLIDTLSRYAVLEPVEGPAADDDHVVCNLTFTHQGQQVARAEEQTLRLRRELTFSDGVLKNFSQLMQGVAAGEKRTGKVAVSHTSVNPVLREEEIDVEFEVLEVKRARLPEMTPEFLGRISDAASAEDVLKWARHDLERQLAYQQQRRVRAQITKVLTESADWALPPELLKRQARRELERAAMELRRSGFSDDEIQSRLNHMRQDISAYTATSLKEHFILERIAEEEKIDATDADFDAEVALMAQQEGESPRKVRSRIEKRGLMDALRNQIVESKVLDMITAFATIKESAYTPEASKVTAVSFFIGGEEVEIPEAKHGGDATPLTKETQRV